MSAPESFFAPSTTKNLMDTSTSTDPGYLSNHDKANVITTTIGGGFSIIGVAFIVISYLKLVQYKAGGTTAQTILLYISIADFVAAVSNVVSVWLPMEKTPTPGCRAGGFLIIFASTASFFWTSCLAIYLYLIITNRNYLISQKKKMLISHGISWGLPLFFACLALGCDALGPAPIFKHENETYLKLTTGGWCWIKEFENKSETIAWTMMTSKLWELISYLLITVLCCAILVQLHWKTTATNTIGEDTLVEARKIEKRMMFIPVAFILLRIWGTVRYFAYVSTLPVRTEVLKNKTLYALQGLGDSSQGFTNSIFFCLSNKRVYQYWNYVLSNYLPDFLCYNPDSETSERTPLIHSLDIQKIDGTN